jgi:hypothetical protein
MSPYLCFAVPQRAHLPSSFGAQDCSVPSTKKKKIILRHHCSTRKFASPVSTVSQLLLREKSISYDSLTKIFPAILLLAIFRCPAMQVSPSILPVSHRQLFPKSTYVRVQASKYLPVCLTSTTETSAQDVVFILYSSPSVGLSQIISDKITSTSKFKQLFSTLDWRVE